MKKFLGALAALILLCAVSLALADVPVDEAHFPDDHFRYYVEDQLDKNHDNILSDAEIANVKEIECNWMQLQSVQGVEYFTELKSLLIYNNECSLDKLDVSANTKLENLWCDDTGLTSLDLSNNPALTLLLCGNNPLNTLDLSHNPELKEVLCANDGLTALDVSHNPKLTSLTCTWNKLTSLDLSRNTKLESLNCWDNRMAVVDVSSCPKLCETVQGNPRLTDSWKYSYDCFEGSLSMVTVDRFTRVIAGDFISEPTDLSGLPEPEPEPVPEPQETEITVNGLTYELHREAKTATLVKVKSKKVKKVTIPATVKDSGGKKYKVTAIAANACRDRTKLTTLVIGKNVKKIGNKAFFNCKKLNLCTFKGTAVTKIGKGAFQGVKGRVTFKIPKKKLYKYRKMIEDAYYLRKATYVGY